MPKRTATRLWISGIEAVQRKIGVNRVMDLSATPFFLRGSGYAEGTLLPWTPSSAASSSCRVCRSPRTFRAARCRCTANCGSYRVPGDNRLGSHGRWAFAAFTDIYAMQHDFARMVEAAIAMLLDAVIQRT